jgi:hypothetical protein
LTTTSLPVQHAEELNTALVEAADAIQPYPTGDPLFHVRLFRHGTHRHTLLLQIHHLISDGWSIAILYRDLSELYCAAAAHRSPHLPQLPHTFAELCVWMRSERHGHRLQQQLDTLRSQFPSKWPPLPFPSDGPEPCAPTREVDTETLLVRRETLTRLRAATKTNDTHAGRAAQLLTAIATTLFATTRQPEIRIGMMVANRARADAEHLIGYFVNTALVRLTIDPAATIGQLLAQANTQVLRAIANQEVPIQDVITHLRHHTQLGAAQPYQVTLALNTMRATSLQLDGIDCNDIDLQRPSRRHAATSIHQRWVFDETADELRGTLTYRTDSTEPDVARTYIVDFQHALAATASPERQLDEILQELPASPAPSPPHGPTS